ncbi:MAG: hypothetical protein QNJ58_16255 [Desulfobacterales bacterium]|nr:hypothetical protein [Desulfobacterales bacterium]
MSFIRITCWIPIVLWLVLNAYVTQFDGWGRWAAAPVLLIPLFASAAFSLFGAASVLSHYSKKGAIVKSDILATIISMLPIIIVFINNLVK